MATLRPSHHGFTELDEERQSKPRHFWRPTILILLGVLVLLVVAASAISFQGLPLSLGLFGKKPSPPVCGRGEVYIRLLGQSIIQWDYRNTNASSFAAMSQVLKDGNPDVIFTDLELAINGSFGGIPSRGGLSNVIHVAGPWVLDLLQQYGVNLLVNSNNHAYDLQMEGILSTLQEMDNRNIPHSGIGRNVTEALAPAYLTVGPNNAIISTVGVVSAPTLYTYGGISNDTNGGVNAMQLDPATQTLDPLAYQANTDAILNAVRNSDITISYHHNHYFEPVPGTSNTDEMFISNWWRGWAHHAIDQGADMYVSHGSTKLHEIEIYKGKPIFYGLGSFAFQTRKNDGSYDIDSWESVIADVCMTKSGIPTSIRLIPIVLNDQGGGVVNSEFYKSTRGIPLVETGPRGLEILHRVQNLSSVRIEIDYTNVQANVVLRGANGLAEYKEHTLTATNNLDGEKDD